MALLHKTQKFKKEKGRVLILDVVSYFCPSDNSASNGFISLSIPACLYSCLYTTFKAGSTINTLHLLSSPPSAFVTAPSQSKRNGISFEVGSCPEIFFFSTDFGTNGGLFLKSMIAIICTF